MGNLCKSIPIILVFIKASSLVVCFSWNTDDLPDRVICNITICGDNTTFYSKFNWASDQRWQLELAFELESDI